METFIVLSILITGETIPYVYNSRTAHTTTSSYFIPSNAVSTSISKTNHFGAEKMNIMPT